VVPITPDPDCKSFSPQRAGLCATCTHARLVVSSRGSAFLRCALADLDAAFPRYPPLPVRACDGYRRADPQPPSDV
jgi:hypothetical protein